MTNPLQVLSALGRLALSSEVVDPDIALVPSSAVIPRPNSLIYLSEVTSRSRLIDFPTSLMIPGMAIVHPSVAGIFSGIANWVAVENPRYCFALVCNELFPIRNGEQVMGKKSRKPYSVRNSGIFFRSRTFFSLPFIKNGVTILPKTSIGKGTFVSTGSVIGSDGFGFERPNDSAPAIRLPHYGGVTIGDRCEIGSVVTIDRGTFDNTLIGNDVKLDNRVHVGHNALIDSGSMVAAGVAIGGSARIGANVWLGLNATVSNGIEIGAGAFVGLGSAVISDVAPGDRVFGSPARKLPN